MPGEGEHACPYCQMQVATLRGVHSHIMQNKKCRARMNAADSDSGEPELELSHKHSVNVDDVRDLEDDSSMQVDADLWESEDHDVPMGIDPPTRATTELEGSYQSPRRATVEDELEEPADVDDSTYLEAYPKPAGTAHGQGKSAFEKHRKVQEEDGQSPWTPFESAEEWELAQWLMTSGVSQNKVNDFLKLKKVSSLSPVIRIRIRILIRI